MGRIHLPENIRLARGSLHTFTLNSIKSVQLSAFVDHASSDYHISAMRAFLALDSSVREVPGTAKARFQDSTPVARKHVPLSLDVSPVKVLAPTVSLEHVPCTESYLAVYITKQGRGSNLQSTLTSEALDLISEDVYGVCHL